jgi:hypothetical protein
MPSYRVIARSSLEEGGSAVLEDQIARATGLCQLDGHEYLVVEVKARVQRGAPETTLVT